MLGALSVPKVVFQGLLIYVYLKVEEFSTTVKLTEKGPCSTYEMAFQQPHS